MPLLCLSRPDIGRGRRFSEPFPAPTGPDAPTLSISTEKVCFIIAKAREFNVKDAATIWDDGSNPADDRTVEVVEDRGDDPIVWELAAFIGTTNEDEQVDLVTLMWFGRGDGGLQDWDELRAEAARAHNRHTVLYLLRTPLRPDFLEDALAEFAARAKTSNGNIWDSSGPEWTLTSGPAARGYASAQGGTEEGCSATRRQFREMLTAGLRLQSTG